jgi:hypothetical protein
LIHVNQVLRAYLDLRTVFLIGEELGEEAVPVVAVSAAHGKFLFSRFVAAVIAFLTRIQHVCTAPRPSAMAHRPTDDRGRLTPSVVLTIQLLPSVARPSRPE